MIHTFVPNPSAKSTLAAHADRAGMRLFPGEAKRATTSCNINTHVYCSGWAAQLHVEALNPTVD
eukprot:2792414-Alexandrium_andersonii.AAC.1